MFLALCPPTLRHGAVRLCYGESPYRRLSTEKACTKHGSHFNKYSRMNASGEQELVQTLSLLHRTLRLVAHLWLCTPTPGLLRPHSSGTERGSGVDSSSSDDAPTLARGDLTPFAYAIYRWVT